MISQLFIISLTGKPSGGRQQLLITAETIAKDSGYSPKELVLLSKAGLANVNFCFFFYLFRIILLQFNPNNRFQILYSDPIFSFLELVIRGRNATRFVQSIDHELYDNHPKLHGILTSFLKFYIKFSLKYGSNNILVNSKVGEGYVKLFGRKYQVIKPTLILAKADESAAAGLSPYFVSLMSNPAQKGIGTLVRIASDFPELNFIVLSQTAVEGISLPNIVNYVNLPRSHVTDFLMQSQAHLCFSKKESIGLPIYEAMALNVPSVSLLSPATAKAHSAGLLVVPEYDSQSFASIVEYIQNKEERTNIVNAQNVFVKKEFNIVYE